jgi:hypothetical protein
MKYAMLLAALLVGCSGSEPSQEKKFETARLANQEAMLNPEVVGTTTDGESIRRYRIVSPKYDGTCCSSEPHWVYTVGPAVSVSTTVSSGKSSHVETTVTVNGKPIDLVQARIQIDAALAAQQKRDLETYRALKSKYEPMEVTR